jgi:hypothetical protein
MHRLAGLCVIAALALATPAHAGRSRLLSVPAAGGAPRTIVTGPFYESVRWNADGTGLLAMRGTTLVSIDPATGAHGQVRQFAGDQAFLSPRADLVANLFTEAPTRVEVQTAAGEPRSTVPLVDDDAGFYAWAAFSPDETRIAATVPPYTSHAFLAVADVATGTILRKVRVGAFAEIAEGAFDVTGEHVLFNALRGGLRSLDVSTGKVRRVGRFFLTGAYAPTGTALAAASGGQVWFFPGGTHKVYGSGFPDAIAWAPDSSAVYVGAGPLNSKRRDSRVVRVTRTGKPQTLAGVGRGHVQSITPSPDGTQLIVVVGS